MSSLVIIYTDGISKPNPGKCGCGVVILDEAENIIGIISEYLGNGTNNVAELTGILRGISRARELKAQKVLLYTDSEICIKIIKKGTTNVIHLQNILAKCLQEMEGMNIQIEWVKGHNNNKWNEIADRLANNSLIMLDTDNIMKSIPSDTITKVETTIDMMYLKCPFSEKDEVKKMGAKWNANAKKWTVENTSSNKITFSKWL